MIGLDVGGANIKIATDESYEIIYFPIWKKLNKFNELLQSIQQKYRANEACVVITAELSDVFKRKEDGIKIISNELESIFDKVFYLDIEGNIVNKIDDPKRFMATNWIASCKYLLEEGYRNFVFVDIGSTTTDIIPVKDRIAGKTDLQRLLDRELIYIGVLRTPTFHLTDLNTATEYFSITADVFRVTEDITEEDYTCETPDERGKSYEDCLNRIARLFCSDLTEISRDFLIQFAISVKEKFIEIVLNELMKFKIRGFKTVIGCGIGEFLIREAARRANMDYISIEEHFGFSAAFPAYAMLQLCKKFLGSN
jgi:probable H4MPT-linked C1 transfer pathway protein